MNAGDRHHRDSQKLEFARELITQWSGLFKSLHLYDANNQTIRSIAERIREAILHLTDGDGELQLAIHAGALFVDRMRIRESWVGSSAYHQLIDRLRSIRIRSIQIDSNVDVEEIELFARSLADEAEKKSSPEDITRELRIRGVTQLELEFGEDDIDLTKDLDAEAVSKRIYLRSIGVLKSVFYESRTRNRINSRQVKRVVQEMVDSLEGDPGYLLNLTSVKNYDEYTFNHSVNVGVLAVGLGRAIGLSRRHLYVIGQAGMLHDLGKLCVPKEVLNKPGRLTPDERRVIQSHPVEGFVSIATKQGVSADSIAIALAAYEHHLNADGSGYPEGGTNRPLGLLSRIIAVVDRYDAMTSARVYRSAPIAPAKALAILFQSQAGQVDTTLLRYFMNMVGYYPLGTTVRLSDMSVGIVISASADSRRRHLPVVKIVLDQSGQPGSGAKIDLAHRVPGSEPLSVVETLDAADYGIEVMDYIL